jgi:large subunit ribosomal protein L6
MSRIGKKPVVIPAKVEVTVNRDLVTVKGPKGELTRTFGNDVKVVVEDGNVLITSGAAGRAFQGLYRSLIANMVEGVAKGFTKKLQIVGVGYRAEKKGAYIRFDLGYSHPIYYEVPGSVKADVEKGGGLTLSSADNEALGEAAATIRSFRRPEPYKGKGIKYSDEVILRKAGKAGGKK